MKHCVYLGLGSNLGDREENIRQAVSLIQERIGKVVRQSSMIETEPWGFESDNRFLNAVILCETEKTPREVLRITQRIEKEMGRKKKTSLIANSQEPIVRYHDRPIDIDILLYDDLTVDEPDLKIPHPLMRQRDFVMIPLNEITNS
ncbi:MAG: 2-amino-4-hydroxy-6-hydroxymethyldihydropteridine diphosphokinase [Prevotella sp.]|nr:2-amino-4-hydroxy-6-hydroxymethyldihydropteridine diphosphokinase [Prevotella sp.]